MYSWRPASLLDVPVIAHISSIALAGYPEEEVIFQELIRLCPQGAFALEIDGAVCGYLLSHPWRRLSPPALNTTIGSLPADADCWYIHDLSLLPEARGFGAAKAAVDLACASARNAGFDVVTLVAVNNAGDFWQAQGFAPVMDDDLRRQLASYGTDALYMERPAG
jgi:ribosomal protein S18 acetylase RimI-like enzyme